MQEILSQNKESWNAIADNWFGTTALPEYGCLIPDERQLNLFGNVAGKRLLEIGCGSGHSLLYNALQGAGELWGLDISERQLQNAKTLLSDHAVEAKLFCSPMEENPGLPEDYFNIVYSVYALGWTMDLAVTLKQVHSYLKDGGVFIFSWDHPFMHCVTPKNGAYVLDDGFFGRELFTFEKGGMPVSLYNRRISDYINALYEAGFVVERMVEETDARTRDSTPAFSSGYYAPAKAKLMPLSFVIKARKRSAMEKRRENNSESF